MSSHICDTHEELRIALTTDGDGFGFVYGKEMKALFDERGSLSDWNAFADSWNRLEVDRYMADGGRYRRRRYATFSARAGRPFVLEPHQPHYQTLDYNPLNGGVARWFEPIEPEVAASASLSTILTFCTELFDPLVSGHPEWHVEVHQFRIEARAREEGRPTPEGLHRDGVDYVLVLLIARQNIARGMTTIHALDGQRLGHFTLTDPFDAALVDDSRVAHGVTPVEPIDEDSGAYRDVLVVTFRRTRKDS